MKGGGLAPTYGAEMSGNVRICAHPDCTLVAEHRAPKSRSAIRDYWWFCMDHVRIYNASWNYYAGMTDDEVELEIQKDTFWHRPTWKLGDRRSGAGHGRVGDPFGVFDDGPNGFHGGGDGNGHDKEHDGEYMHSPLDFGGRQAEALAVMELSPPVTISKIKGRYKELVKLHHPDANGGSRVAEERLKAINIAYGTLMQALAD